MQLDDYNWFKANYSSLFKEYGKSYLAIKDKKVLGKYNSYAEGVRETQKSQKLGSFIIQLCDGTPDAYTNTIASMNFA